MSERLTNTLIDKLPATGEKYDVRDSALAGFFVRVGITGVKTYYLNYTTAQGRRRTQKIGNANIITPTQAREAAQVILASISTTGIDPREKLLDSPTLRNVLEEFRSAGGSKYIGDLTEKTFDWLMDREVKKILEIEIDRWREMERKKPHKKRPGQIGEVVKSPTYATINKKTVSLKALLNWAVKKRVISENPLLALKKLKETDSVVKTRYLKPDERERLLNTIENRKDHMKPMIIIALNTGIRQGALFALRWDDINFSEHTMTLNAKNAKSRKHMIVPLNQRVIDTLLIWRKVAPNKSELVFPSFDGKEFDNVKNAWSNILKQANISNFRWHDMRHDFASRLVMKGVDLNTVRELLGHSDLKMTMRYAHLAPEAKKKAVDLLN